MKESVDKKYIVTDGDYSCISLDLTQHPSDIKKIVVAFLDIALRMKDICPIVDNHLQLLEFPDKDSVEVASRFPFDYRWYNDYPLGYVLPHDIMESEYYDEDPPF